MSSLPSSGQTADFDPVSGVHSHRAFSRQVNQVACDGDVFAVAIISLENFDMTTQVAGFEASDDLLAAVGRALTNHQSATTIVARTGDHEFSVLSFGFAGDLDRWVSPVVTSARMAITDWATGHSAFELDLVIPPTVRTGAAVGSGAQVRDEAGRALTVAINNVEGDEVVHYRKEDRRLQAIEAEMKRNSRTLEALTDETVLIANQRIEPVSYTHLTLPTTPYV